jgi:D-Tyr-tRNAtyr deacylase
VAAEGLVKGVEPFKLREITKVAAPIKIVVKGTDNSGVDAPTVDDLLMQIQDFVSVLKGVERGMTGGEEELIWRVTDVTKNSPLAFEITPYPKKHAMNIDNRAEEVVVNTSAGLHAIAEKGERPLYFSDAIVSKAEKIYARVTNGLSETTIDFGAYKIAKPVTISKVMATQSMRHISTIKTPSPVPYRELGSIEGFITKVERDGHGRPIVWITTRLDKQEVKCLAEGNALNRIGHMEVERVWKGSRVKVFGDLYYKALGKLDKIEADTVQFYEDDEKLPSIDVIVDPNFALGVESAEYLRQLREDG